MKIVNSVLTLISLLMLGAVVYIVGHLFVDVVINGKNLFQ